MARSSNRFGSAGGESPKKAPARGRRSSVKKKFLPAHLKNVLAAKKGYGRAAAKPAYGKGKFKNKRELKVKTTRHVINQDAKPFVTQEPVRDRPVDLYTDIFTSTLHQYSTEFETDSQAPDFESETILNELENAGTTIISDENEENLWGTTQLLYIPAGRRCLQNSVAVDLLDTGFEDLDTKHLERPQVPPTIESYEIANLYRTFEDGKEGQSAKLPMTDHGRSHVLDLMGRNKDPNSFKFSIRANHHLLIHIDAYNWYDAELDEKNVDGITFKWTWTAGTTNYEKNDIDKIVGTSRLLSIENIQREHIGTYTCEVANKYGKKFSFPVDLDVERPGEMREVRLKVTAPGGDESEILTNQFEWVANDASDEHDEKYNVRDNKHIYNEEEQDWVSLYWEVSKDSWHREEDNSPYVKEDEKFDSNLEFEGDTFEDAEVAGSMINEEGYRVRGGGHNH